MTNNRQAWGDVLGWKQQCKLAIRKKGVDIPFVMTHWDKPCPISGQWEYKVITSWSQVWPVHTYNFGDPIKLSQ